jgi:YVTN family beta-propeller protein
VINTNTNTLTDTIPIPIGPSDLLNTPRAVVVAPDGKYAYVSDNSSNLVSVINTATNKVVLSIPVGPNPIGITITPNGQYVYVADNSDPNPRYSERGSLAPLRILSQSQGSLRTNLGMRASYTWKVVEVLLTPSLRASWQHEYFYSALPVSAQFASGAGSAFTVNGPAEGHDSALIDAGLNIQWTSTIGTYFGYNGQVGRSRYDSQGGVCSVHLSF